MRMLISQIANSGEQLDLLLLQLTNRCKQLRLLLLHLLRLLMQIGHTDGGDWC
jgi:hypothetical protein